MLLAAALAVVPLVLRGTSCGHDFDFHLVSWIDALDSWRHGIVYPHWATTPNYMAGEPRFVFYPPLTWMLGAALGAVLPWMAVPVAMTFLLLAGTGLATRALARQALPEGAATLAGCVAIFSGYSLYTVYERSAFAELAGGIWIPLLLLLVLSERQRVVDGTAAAGLALVVAGAWLSNAPVGVMACYLLAGFAVVVAVMRRSLKPVLRAALGAVLGLGLAAFYLMPAAVEQKWVDIEQATGDAGEQIQNSFLFGHHADPQLALHDAELQRVSWIAVAMLAVIAAALVISWRRKKLAGARSWWVPLALIPAGVLFLLLPLSLPVWNLLPKMQFLQFPWRWLVVLEAPLGIFVAAAVEQGVGSREQGIGRPERLQWIGRAVCGLVFVGLTVFVGRVFFEECDPYDAIPGMLQDYHNGDGFQGTDEYEPVGAENGLVAENLPAACLVADANAALGKTSADNPQPSWAAEQKSCVAVVPDPESADAKHWRAEGSVPSAGYLVLRLRRYPAWNVTVNGARVADLGTRDDGLMVVPVSPGSVKVQAEWRATPDMWKGRLISFTALTLTAALGLVTVLGAVGRRSQSQLK
ncbi:6-pyruvoyl-tetrahydropterin synthase-related protein [Occallatibacter riparius]|uniref:6-pyruvoyl-tetrahydropterin synthase-related protein n=1 Tax=Occallatibacter riparius TaxID=1002689 RepID=A0A9J7BMD1_9BACT|nr:6-pyruvoyl-tetrahydropterin synthase-related protein [Occallatibacter riparius]UWZ83896.1 6-pyruvoyl-tetrahydropterin synthase-related protein [Occallatibacter riparius]